MNELDEAAFEKALLSPNMKIIQCLLLGKFDIVLEQGDVLGFEDYESAQIYRALLNLSGFASFSVQNKRRLLKETIENHLSCYLKSDLAKLEEILFFVVTSKGNN